MGWSRVFTDVGGSVAPSYVAVGAAVGLAGFWAFDGFGDAASESIVGTTAGNQHALASNGQAATEPGGPTEPGAAQIDPSGVGLDSNVGPAAPRVGSAAPRVGSAAPRVGSATPTGSDRFELSVASYASNDGGETDTESGGWFSTVGTTAGNQHALASNGQAATEPGGPTEPGAAQIDPSGVGLDSNVGPAAPRVGSAAPRVGSAAPRVGSATPTGSDRFELSVASYASNDGGETDTESGGWFSTMLSIVADGIGTLFSFGGAADARPTSLVLGMGVAASNGPSVASGARDASVTLPDYDISNMEDVDRILGRYFEETWGYSAPVDNSMLAEYAFDFTAIDAEVRLAALLRLSSRACRQSNPYEVCSRRPEMRPLDERSCELAGLADSCDTFVAELLKATELGVRGAGDAHAFAGSDISQGPLGDCFYLASLGSMTLASPAMLERRLVDNQDGTYTVSFFNKETGGLEPVTVTPDEKEFAAVGDQGTAELRFTDGPAWLAERLVVPSDEIWVQIYEQAYAEWKGGYDAIDNGGDPSDSLYELTGESEVVYPANDCGGLNCVGRWLRRTLRVDRATRGADASYQKMIEWQSEGRPMVASVVGAKVSGLSRALSYSEEQEELIDQYNLLQNHAYSAEVSGDMVTVYNPWGWPEDSGGGERFDSCGDHCGAIEIPREDFVRIFPQVAAGASLVQEGE